MTCIYLHLTRAVNDEEKQREIAEKAELFIDFLVLYK